MILQSVRHSYVGFILFNFRMFPSLKNAQQRFKGWWTRLIITCIFSHVSGQHSGVWFLFSQGRIPFHYVLGFFLWSYCGIETVQMPFCSSGVEIVGIFDILLSIQMDMAKIKLIQEAPVHEMQLTNRTSLESLDTTVDPLRSLKKFISSYAALSIKGSVFVQQT